MEAPPFPSYYTKALANFSSSKPIQEIRNDLERAFYECNVRFEPHPEHAMWYECAASEGTLAFEFEVCIFNEKGQHATELRCIFGNRVAFGHTIAAMARSLRIPLISWGR